MPPRGWGINPLVDIWKRHYTVCRFQAIQYCHIKTVLNLLNVFFFKCGDLVRQLITSQAKGHKGENYILIGLPCLA